MSPQIEKTSDVAVLEKPMRKGPKQYQVILFNDEFTPMDFVVEVLMEIFDHSVDQAEAVMWKIHTEGKGVCGVYPFEIAHTKQDWTLQVAKKFQFPLCVEIEEVPE